MNNHNKIGVIAETYEELQSLSILKTAREKTLLPKASLLSSMKAILQSAEIALINLGDLLDRTIVNLGKDEIQKTVTKLFWIQEFHKILYQLSLLSKNFALKSGTSSQVYDVEINDSIGFKKFFRSQKKFDKSISDYFRRNSIKLKTVLAESSLENNEFRAIHYSRISNHMMNLWESNFADGKLEPSEFSYDSLVAGKTIKRAVFAAKLDGDNFFIQFRSLHQIPEIICYELNDHLEKAILELRNSNYSQALEYIQHTNIFFVVILASLNPLIDCLSTKEYHAIRENLGLTSGSHSINLHYNLFRGYYIQLGEEIWKVVQEISKRTKKKEHSVIKNLFDNRDRSFDNWNLFQILNESLKLKSQIEQWRRLHIQLPRNNLGGKQIKSLTGSADAIRAVQAMMDSANTVDPLNKIVELLSNSSSLSKTEQPDFTKKALPLTDYINSFDSWDSKILSATGELTQNNFPHVQQRTGYFAGKCPFNSPAKKKI